MSVKQRYEIMDELEDILEEAHKNNIGSNESELEFKEDITDLIYSMQSEIIKQKEIYNEMLELINDLSENLELQLSMRGCGGLGDCGDRKGDVDSYGGNDLLFTANQLIKKAEL